MLESIDKTGSISAAGRAHQMSYRRAWLLVDELNQLLTLNVETELDQQIALARIHAQIEELDGRLQTQNELISGIRLRSAATFDTQNPDNDTLNTNLRKWRAAKAALQTIQTQTAVAEPSASGDIAPQNLIGDNAYDSDRLDTGLSSTESRSLLHIGVTDALQLRTDVS